ncbi:NEL-type E3 ubiquitin ligase domain-containing protein [Pseudomonas yamanorum]|uniref:RING-type E3 ubiquitin transferase n=1 Tax=Pseudomonas yamanorum TaxID=515393 RepID=A0A7Y8EKQ5_9PSED|nr:NEL-type E3 ubiquitin ligase domain-containing protein [Pseudomonas yamanorum]NWE16491.1 hypothetical protein [Pseudomonas yamanorum]
MTISTPAPEEGLHTALIKQRLPLWVAHSAGADIRRLRGGLLPGRVPAGPPPAWLTHAPAALRVALSVSQQRSHASNLALAKCMKLLKGPTEFAEPLLLKALSERFGQAPDAHKNALFYLRYRQAPVQHTLLQAALLNFEGNEDFSEVALGETSAIAPVDALVTDYGEFSRGGWPARYRYTEKLPIPPQDFSTLCRTLDLGRQYQDHLKQIFDAPDTAPQVRARMIQAQKDLLAVRLHTARIKQEVSESFYAVLLKLLAGTGGLTLDDHPVGYSQLSVLGCPLGEVVLIGPGVGVEGDAAKALGWSALLTPVASAIDLLTSPPTFGRFVAWIPGAPLYPLKEYPSMQAFEKDLAINLRSSGYQRLLASRVPQGDAPAFLKRLKDRLHTYQWNATKGLYEQVYDQQISLNLRQTPISGELFGDLYEKHVQRLKDDALKLAVPTAEADRKAAQERHEHWLSLGMNLLNVAAFFVPGLGEVMLAVTAIQLGLEVYHGIESWKEGDLDAAWGHLESVALNVAFMATLGTAGALAARKPVIQVSKWVDGLVPVKLPSGEARLWKPDLEPYRSDVVLDPDLLPNAQGQYEVEGKIYVRIGDGVYEKGFDSRLKKWRIKHPDNPNAYQPELHSNHAGAWRAVHERPRDWERLTLLRRLGHDTLGFSDETLATIGDISGVSDEALRKIHIDGLPLPAPLADTLRQFRVDQEVDELVARIRSGAGLGRHYEHVLPLVVEMPRWPVGRVLEVFEGPEPWGRSRVYGSRASAADVRASIKITRGELRKGKLPQHVLADLGEDETAELLGSQANATSGSKEQAFNGRLADFAQKRKKALFDSLSRPMQAGLPDSEWLARRFPMLSRDAMAEVLAQASEQDRLQIRTQGRVPARLDNLARGVAQQVRLSRAIAGMQREALAGADSDRLALHSLERLPGWPGNLRLEVRADSIGGRVLDSIGPDSAPVRRYLVKDGDTFQACDANGAELNGKVPGSRNWFQSIMHALPDAARRELGVPLVSQDAELQRLLAQHGLSHRKQMSEFLKQRIARFRPKWRLPGGRPGYAMTGRGDAFAADASLVARVRDLYPDLSDEQASRFVLGRLGGGETTQQVFHLLTTRQREFDGLRATLDEWARAVGEPQHLAARRRQLAEDLIACWRQNLYRGIRPHARLNLQWGIRLPTLQADFSHVYALRLQGPAMLGENGSALFQQFPGLRQLDLYVAQAELGAVGERLRNLPSITRLSIDGDALNFANGLEPVLNGMPQLETLSLCGALESLDVSSLPNLETLNVSGSLATFPEGLASLERLVWTNLSGTRINRLPEALFQGSERVWRGLHLNWPTFEARDFLRVFDYLHDHPAHLVDEERLAQGYGEGSLRALRFGGVSSFQDMTAAFKGLGVSPRERVLGVNALRNEHTALVDELEAWKTRELRVDRRQVDFFYRQRAAENLLECWREGLDRRTGSDAQPGPSSAINPRINTLDLSGGVLGDFPRLPTQGFAHVQHLNLDGVRASVEALDGVLARFTQLNRLSLGRNNLATLPARLTELRGLEHLDLTHNQLTLTPVMQQQLTGLASLQELSLAHNRVGQLDVSGLTQLRGLDLSHTGITAWPTGVLDLPHLRRLDMSHSAITQVPGAALVGHDPLMRGTNLRGCRLGPQALADLQGFTLQSSSTALTELQRHLASRPENDSVLGIPRHLLAEGRTGGDPEYFPLEVRDNPDLLIALPLDSPGGEASLTAAVRMQRLDPALSDARAVQRIADLSASGLSSLDLEARLTQWSAQHQALVRQLNDWIDIRAYREGGGWVSAVDRRRAADRLLDSWRHNLRTEPETGRQLLDLSDLYLGDLPPVAPHFAHVTTLNLSAVKLTEQGSNEFLRAFPQVRSLILSHNGLSRLPEAVSELSALTRLEAGHNNVWGLAELQATLNELPALEWLDLSANSLSGLDISRLPQLETLDLHGNILVDWPVGVLEAPRLRSLNLSNNQIESVPADAWYPEHLALMAGINLSDNLLLEGDLRVLHDYLLDTGHGLGFTEEEIDRLLDGYENDDEANGNGPDDEAHPEQQPPQEQKDQWFNGVPAESEKHAIWDELKAAEGSADFFQIISQLRHAKDYEVDRAELTRRVWDVLEGAHAQPDLRDALFLRARASIEQVTCGDGWILLFSDLEVRAYEFKVLQTVSPGQEGLGLFRLARSIIRLEEVEATAETAIRQHPGIDQAEVRLAYRIRLAQRLELPRQPSTMIYENFSGVTPADIDSAYTRIIAGENTPAFTDKLVTRDYWVDYLKRQHPAEFSAMASGHAARVEALEAQHSDLNPAYLAASVALDTQRIQEEKALALQLTARERTAMGL